MLKRVQHDNYNRDTLLSDLMGNRDTLPSKLIEYQFVRGSSLVAMLKACVYT